MLSISILKNIKVGEQYMNNKAIETLAVSAVRDIIVQSEYLDPFINDNDKEPSFDGFVYLYSEKGKKKEALVGRIAVQVKGTQKKASSKAGLLKFTAKVSDLRPYLREGGIVYFVVFISNNGKTKHIFYCDLLPMKIRKILENIGTKQTTQIHLKPFPTNPKQLRGLFVAFYEHKSKQAILHNLKTIPTIDDLQKQGNLNQISLSSAGSRVYSNPIDAILYDEVYIYASVNGTGALFPIDIISETLERVVFSEFDSNISINNRLYYTKYNVNYYEDKDVLKFGKCISLTSPKHKSKGKQTIAINFSPCSSLRHRANDLAFLINLIDHDGFYRNEEFYSYVLNLDDKVSFPVLKFKKELQFLEDILKVFDVLHISDDLELDKLTERDYHELNVLIDAFAFGKEISDIRNDIPVQFCMAIGNLRISLFQKRNEDTGKTKLYDFFDDRIKFGFQLVDSNDDEQQHFSPAFAMLDADGWRLFSNINYTDVVPAFKRIYDQHGDQHIFTVANNSLLSILLAYDACNKSPLILLAKELASWINKNALEDIKSKRIYIINYYQTFKRMRELTIEERRVLLDIAEDNEEDIQLRVGAHILLGNFEIAELYLSRMNEQDQKQFKQYPIYHFMDKSSLVIA